MNFQLSEACSFMLEQNQARPDLLFLEQNNKILGDSGVQELFLRWLVGVCIGQVALPMRELYF